MSAGAAATKSESQDLARVRAPLPGIVAVASPPKGWFRKLTDCGHSPADDAHQRRQKSVFTGASFLKAAMCPFWCGMFVSVGSYIAGAIPLIYAAVTGLSILRMSANKDIGGFRVRQAWFIFLAPMGVTLVIGGLHASSAVILWSFLAPLIVLLFQGPKQAVPWLVGFVGLVIASLGVEAFELLPVVAIGPVMRNVFAAMNVIVVSLIVFTTVVYYAKLLEEGRAVQEQLRQEVREARRLGQYHLERKLGEGGMGIVYEARHAMLRRRTAVKLIQSDRVDPIALERFEREVQITAELTHPNTVAIYDYGRTPDGIFYYAMELLEGCDLERLIAQDGPQDEDRVVHILRQVAGALAEAHAAGLVHRDIKPANIILCERGGQKDVAKVVDFGLVKRVDGNQSDAQLTGLNVITGTPAFMAPEAIARPDVVDARSDL
jgi:tRNA A-37 threonylcarbamoyl transferase component Bud32